MGTLWGLLKNNGWLFWASVCIPNVVLCILCTPLLKTWQNIIQEKSQDDSCKTSFFSPGAIFFADTVQVNEKFLLKGFDNREKETLVKVLFTYKDNKGKGKTEKI